jgi:hypothetical protein
MNGFNEWGKIASEGIAAFKELSFEAAGDFFPDVDADARHGIWLGTLHELFPVKPEVVGTVHDGDSEIPMHVKYLSEDVFLASARAIERLEADSGEKPSDTGPELGFEIHDDLPETAAEKDPQVEQNDDELMDVIKPTWNPTTGRLCWGNRAIRQYRGGSIAKNVTAILNAFEEEGWPEHVHDPMPGGKDSQRLHEAIRTLNKDLEHIRFRCNGDGTGIIWERT